MGIEQEHFQRICGVFVRATQITDTKRRAAFVEESCKDYPGLRGEVRGLLDIYEREPEGHMDNRIRLAIERVARDLLR